MRDINAVDRARYGPQPVVKMLATVSNSFANGLRRNSEKEITITLPREVPHATYRHN